jgi:small nuclear ribonucleoprotein
MTKRPLDILDQVLNRQPVIVSLKGGRELRGILQGYDVHMNLVLDKAEEVEAGQSKSLGTLIVRGDNVIYISPQWTNQKVNFRCQKAHHQWERGRAMYILPAVAVAVNLTTGGTKSVPPADSGRVQG